MEKECFEISLLDLHFHSRHGVLPQETKVGNEFIVDLTIAIPYDEEILNDDLNATISYADIYEIVAQEMKKPRKLLETVAAVIAERLTKKWKIIETGSISICKSTAPISGITGSAKVTFKF